MCALYIYQKSRKLRLKQFFYKCFKHTFYDIPMFIKIKIF